MKKPFRLRFETVGSLAAIFVGVAALFVSWYQAKVMQAQQHAAVWPILTLDQGVGVEGDDLVFEFSVSNAGVGPAILKYADLKNGNDSLTSWQATTALLPEDFQKRDSGYGSSIRGRALAPGDRFTPYGAIWESPEDAGQISKQLEQVYENVSLTICYCSVFNKCWMTSSSSEDAAMPVRVCPTDKTGIQ